MAPNVPQGLRLIALAAMVLPAWAEGSAELQDLAARIHYGYYQHEPRAIETARAGLDRLGDEADVVYYRDFAALRHAQLGAVDRETLRRLAACAEREADGSHGRAQVEASVLAAACAWVGDDERRFAAALAAARSADADHPRVLLLEAWLLNGEVAAGANSHEVLAAKWTQVVAAFDAFEPAFDDPGWGHAEALAARAAIALSSGQVRDARDLIERALLLAPDYRVAVDLHRQLQGQR